MHAFRIVRDSRWRSQQLLILAYHGISLDDEHEWDGAFYMPQDLLRQRMEVLRRGAYSVLPYEEAVERLYAGNLPPRAVALTFDDGVHDFRVRACPILAEFGYPATVYLTTYFAINRYPVFNSFSYLLWKGRGKTVDLTGVAPGSAGTRLSPRSELSRRQRSHPGIPREENPGNEQLREIARSLATAVGQDFDSLCEREFASADAAA